MGVAENSEYGFKCNFWDVQQWATQSGNQNSSYAQATLHLRLAMIFPDPLNSWNVLCAKFLFSLLVCLALKFTDIIL